MTATESAAPTPTSTAVPSPSPDPDRFALVERTPITAAGFSFLPPPVLHTELGVAQATLANSDQTFLLSLAAGQADASETLGESLASFLANMGRDVPNLASTDPAELTVQGYPAIGSNLSGTLMGQDFKGRITIIDHEEGPRLFALGISMNPPAGIGWDEEGVDLYDQIVDSLQFFEPEAPSASCEVSQDPDYAFTKENPVRVGGGAFGGPARARAYFENLTGPAGELVTYERTGSLPFGDTILDGYSVAYSGIAAPVNVFVDEYSFETLLVPVGFECAGPFPVTP